MKNLLDNLKNLLQKDERLTSEGEILKIYQLRTQKRFLLECLDKNHLYVNYNEIDDEEYRVSREDKKLNEEFYKS